MTNIEKVRAAMECSRSRMLVTEIMDRAGLGKKQVYAALSSLRQRNIVTASGHAEDAPKSGSEKLFWLSDLDDVNDEGDSVENVPLVAHAMRHVARHAGNPFAGLMA